MSDIDNDNEVLFLRGNGSENEDIWDDTALIQAYDKAVNLAKEEVAKRIATDAQSRRTKQKSQKTKHNQTKKPLKKWTVGAPCRAVYSDDGEIYEAIITTMYENSDLCMVKFIGYGNTQRVAISSLLESEGLQSQLAQQKQANSVAENADVETSFFNSPQRPNSTKNKSPNFSRALTMPPDFFTMPPPPLPPQLMAKLPENNTDALSSMLMSWYLSGFHTGYYHGLKQAKENLQQKKRNCDPPI